MCTIVLHVLHILESSNRCTFKFSHSPSLSLPPLCHPPFPSPPSLLPVTTGVSGRICHVSELLSRPTVRGGSGLHVSAPAVPHPLPHTQPPVRLHLRLDATQAEGCSFRWFQQRLTNNQCDTGPSTLSYRR